MAKDEKARKSRAESLRNQIARLTEPKADAATQRGQNEQTKQVPREGNMPATGESPRDFVHRRMRELKKKR